jgi:hypothetical protein
MSVYMRRYALAWHIVIDSELIKRTMPIKECLNSLLLLFCRYDLLKFIKCESHQFLFDSFNIRISQGSLTLNDRGQEIGHVSELACLIYIIGTVNEFKAIVLNSAIKEFDPLVFVKSFNHSFFFVYIIILSYLTFYLLL